MPSSKSNFLDKVLDRLGRLDSHGIQTVVQRLARERRFLETLFNSIEDGIVVIDESGQVLYSNHALSALFGIQPSALEGQHISMLLPDLDWETLRGLDRAGGQRVVRHEFEVHYPRPRFIRLYAAPLDGEAPGDSGLALILHDATEARQKAFEAIESERGQALALLAASVAHEIGNPLNALNLHLQLIERQLGKLARLTEPALERGAGKGERGTGNGEKGKRNAKSGKPSTKVGSAAAAASDPNGFDGAQQEVQEVVANAQKFLSVAKGEIVRLDYIITQFLHAIRPVAPKLEPASLNQVILETIEFLRPEVENRGQRMDQQLAPTLPNAPLDAGQMKQVVVNLAKNAMQAMGRGGVITLRTGATENQVWLSLSDTGRGIPQEQLNRIFEPFFTTKKKGSGLGLMIVQRIVRLHGGRIELDSREGRGTTFRIWLPLKLRQPRLLEASLAGHG